MSELDFDRFLSIYEHFGFLSYECYDFVSSELAFLPPLTERPFSPICSVNRLTAAAIRNSRCLAVNTQAGETGVPSLET